MTTTTRRKKEDTFTGPNLAGHIHAGKYFVFLGISIFESGSSSTSSIAISISIGATFDSCFLFFSNYFFINHFPV